MYISVYCDRMVKGRRIVLPIDLCCSTMPVNTFVLGTIRYPMYYKSLTLSSIK